ncbi:MAG: lipid-A-disaccharide synthase N-terminal domain-containing protein [Planctomycetes bacterium]|nr:lipid-A-disaccharide synthase N-terminal domain-containing protein [Planctomycetota bacterium]
MIESISNSLGEIIQKLAGPDRIWYALGFLGQIVFTMRFVVQWIASEKQGKSVIPVKFWYFSIAGSVVLLIYSYWRKDPVFILAQCFGCFIYFRNLKLLSREKRAAKG